MVTAHTIIKYIVFFPNFIGAVIGGGAAIAGFLLLLFFKHVFVFDFPALAFLKDIPPILIGIGLVVFLVSFLGSTGAVLNGVVAKWLLIVYSVIVSIIILLSIYILAAFYLSHRGESTPTPSTLTSRFGFSTFENDINSDLNELSDTDDEIEKLDEHIKALDNAAHTAVEKVKQGIEGVRDGASGIIKKVDIINASIDKIKDRKATIEKGVHTAKDKVKDRIDDVQNELENVKDSIGGFAFNAMEKIKGRIGRVKRTDGGLNVKDSNHVERLTNIEQDNSDNVYTEIFEHKGNKSSFSEMKTLSSKGHVDVKSRKRRGPKEIANNISTGLGKVANNIRNAVKNTIGMVMALKVVMTETTAFLANLFSELKPEEEERVRWVKPITGKFTGIIFRLSAYPVVMVLGVVGVALEIFFACLVGYLITLKGDNYGHFLYN